MSLCDFIGRSTLLELAQRFELVTPDPFTSRELGGVWAQDYLIPVASPPHFLQLPYKESLVCKTLTAANA